MPHEKLQTFATNAKKTIKKNFRFATLNFIFIILYVNIFQTIFGAENSIVGVIFVIMMSASMARDLTATPLKHLLLQATVLVLMAVSACAVTTLNPWVAAPINFLMVFFILYAYTYEHANHIYFPYILSYLFLIFILPITPDRLPVRVLGMLTGAVCIILYQLFMGRKRVHDTTRSGLIAIIDEAINCVQCLLEPNGSPDDLETVRSNLCKLSRMVYERRKKVLCISEASFAVVDAGRELENLIHLLYELEGSMTPERIQFLQKIVFYLEQFREYIQNSTPLNEVNQNEFPSFQQEPLLQELFESLVTIRERLLHMTMPEKKYHYKKTFLSFSVRVKAAIDFSHVRLIYALRVAALLSIFTLVVQLLNLTYGKWILFTIASVSLPYADDVGTKAKRRISATVLGGIVGTLAYALVPSATGRTIIMMLSGYIGSYFSDYVSTFACSTIGALGGAVFTGSFGLLATGKILLIRLCYVGIGIVIALLGNCLVYPFRRERATKQLWEKYEATTKLLTQVCQDRESDPQLYYSLVIQSYLQEEKLHQNATAEGWNDMKDSIQKCRQLVRHAHRQIDADGTVS